MPVITLLFMELWKEGNPAARRPHATMLFIPTLKRV